MKNDNTEYTENSIRTYTGKVFDLKILDPETICIEDIAHALSYTARFGGHLERLYSVAQHCCHVHGLLPKELRLAGLLHDASEAYLGDMPKPFKKLMPDYDQLEDNLMKVIAQKFGFEYPLHPLVKEKDRYMLDYEWESFVQKNGSTEILEYWSPSKAKDNFLYLYSRLKDEFKPR